MDSSSRSEGGRIPSQTLEHRPSLHVVLVEPEIPPNTGSIARLCAATLARLHLVRPLGFSLDDRYLKRAGLDYWPHVDLAVHDDWAAFLSAQGGGGVRLCFSARAGEDYLAAPYDGAEALYLIFGGETRGLPAAILTAHAAHTYRIPIFSPHVRSLNLSNAVGIVVYEALRQRGVLRGGAAPTG